MALLWVAMLALILSVVQVALVFYGGQLALTAAQDGLRAGRGYDALSTEQAQRSAESFLARAGGTALTSPTVTAAVDDTGATLRVTVSGEVLSVLPGVDLRVSKQAIGGVERVTP